MLSINDPLPLSWCWFCRNEGATLYIDAIGNLRAKERIPAGEVRDWISANRAAIVDEILRSTTEP